MPGTDGWAAFNSTGTKPLPPTAKIAMEGVYTTTNGSDVFGGLVAIKWSYSINDGDTTYHVSGFFGKDIAYFICEGKQLNGDILLNGYWRKMVSTETGTIRLTIAAADGASILLSPLPVVTKGSVIINGVFGNGQAEPVFPVTFTYNRKLNSSPSYFQILAHRAGGRTSDLLPFSENSIGMILKTPEFGSTGIEIDVRLTKDNVPVLYHDEDINIRLTQKSPLNGPLVNFTYPEISSFIRLVNGEKIPKLEDALIKVVDSTKLKVVWLDMKSVNNAMAIVIPIQQKMLQRAKQKNRDLSIYI